MLKRQGLGIDLLHVVFYALIVNKKMYTISACFGFLWQTHVLQINSLHKRAFKFGYVKSILTIEELLTVCLTKQLPQTTPCSTCFPLPSPHAIA